MMNMSRQICRFEGRGETHICGTEEAFASLGHNIGDVQLFFFLKLEFLHLTEKWSSQRLASVQEKRKEGCEVLTIFCEIVRFHGLPEKSV